MNKQNKKLTLVMIAMLLLSACGDVGAVPASVNTLEPVIAVTEVPAEAPTQFPDKESSPERFDQYMGLIYPPLPDGLSPRFSMIIQDSDDNGLSLFSDEIGTMLWLSRLSRYDESGAAYWEVMDILDLTNLEPGLTLLPDGCFLNGSPDSEIFVASRNEVIVMAWRANTKLDKFEVISADGITCHSDKAVDI